MDIDKLRAFIVVAEELNFRKSAEILGMSQPPLTRWIAELERELSTKLFERTTRTVRLTGAGVHLLREAREIVERIENVRTEVRAIGKIRSGTLRIGFSTTAILARFPAILESFQEQFPKLTVELQQGSSDEVLRHLKDDRVDIVFAEGRAAHPDLRSFVVRDEILGVLMPRKHPLARRKEIEVAELKNETFILHPKSDRPEFYRIAKRLFARHRMQPRIYIKKAHELCPALVAVGAGLAFTTGPRSASSDTRFVPVKDLFLPVSVFWSAANENPQLKSFLSFVSENAALGDGGPGCLAERLKMALP